VLPGSNLAGPAPVNCCVPVMTRILKGATSQAYLLFYGSSSPKPSPREARWSITETRAKGDRERSERQPYGGMATGSGGGCLEGGRLATAGYRERSGRCTKNRIQAVLVGTSLQHKAKSSIDLRSKAYTRRSCAEICVFTPERSAHDAVLTAQSYLLYSTPSLSP
jgi:hypothetical protein